LLKVDATNHQTTPFQLKKKFGGGNLKKAKGAAGGARPPFGGQAARLRVTLFAGNGF
jgi:hypothetical protein